MIENLNTLTFRQYGKVFYEGFQHACKLYGYTDNLHIEQRVADKTVETLRFSGNEPVLLDVVEGIPVLCVAVSPSENDMRFFLLDKTVAIDPGIYYNLISLYGSSSIKISKKECSAPPVSISSTAVSPLGLYPKVEIGKVHTLFYQEKEQGFIFKGESHDFWELTYVDRGTLYNIVDGKGYKVNNGEAIFYGKNQNHVQWAEAGASISFITITFDMDFEEASFLTDRKFHVDQEMKELIEKIISEKENGSYYSDDLIICYIKEFIIKLVRSEKLEIGIHRLDTQTRYNIENSIIAKCIDFIHDNIGKKIAVPDIARSIPISQSYLSVIFKRHMNMTLVDYINNYRLEKSKELIKSSEYNFKQISNLLGYTSLHYFSNQFKAKYGISPTEYSKSIKR